MVNINITVDPEHVSTVADVADALRARGMQVEQVLQMGFITGSAPDDSLPALKSVHGVQSVDEDRGYRLPPPAADIQ
ncbi:putative uncharacterized protein [Pseudarthrobacter siccitolerans]|uniref:Ketohydroxyglutarate aldolase n=1 Tax=Pseudarthrobacter siccitolerans TaxID=861266 RepID=A0A024H023_9MICC|nr:hypothetical protein [Pseudarthrobacter siccitolerans]CCQ45071.1 putative uncharacterized protein [Pseudarthrobacter siccitolerans]